MKKIILLVSLLCITLLLISCRNTTKDTVSDNNKLQVYVSFNALYEFAAAVGQDKAEVHTIIPTGAEPHDFEPKAADIAGLSKANLFIYHGLGMEAWAEHAIGAAKNSDLTIIVASDGTNIIENTEDGHDHAEDDDHEHEEDDDHEHVGDKNHDHDEDDLDDGKNHEHDEDNHGEEENHEHNEDHDEKHSHSHGKYDPHTWLSIKEAMISVQNIADGFSLADPDNKDFYQANAANYIKELEGIFQEYSVKFSVIDNKYFVTGHAAFQYFCRDFGLVQKSVEDVFAEGEPSPQQLVKLVEFCREKNVTTIFAEEMASPEVSKTLAKEVGAKVQTIYTMESPEDNLSYLERMKENCERVYQSLKK